MTVKKRMSIDELNNILKGISDSWTKDIDKEISNATRGRNAGNTNRGRKQPAAAIALRSAKRKGSKVSEETKRKMSLASKGKSKSPEARRKNSISKIGKPIPQETRDKIAATLIAKGIKPPQFAVENSRLTNLGRKQTEEHIKKRVSSRLENDIKLNRVYVCSEETKKKLS